MKKFANLAAGLVLTAALAVSVTACTPTKNNPAQAAAQSAHDHDHEPSTTPDGAAVETVDGAEEKKNMVVTEDPAVTVCVYSMKDDHSGLKQNMDTIDGEELDAQKLIDKMAELGVLEKDIKVNSFENKDGALTLDLSSLEKKDDRLLLLAISNTFVQNYDAKTLKLKVDGKEVGEMEFVKKWKEISADQLK
ncbi:MAG: GerMN domain-containing protein [Clostridium sp.]|nr:GerMN domain-containing protein [Clostridium sp.]